MKRLKIAIYVLFPVFIALTACGRKMPPKPTEGTVITYPKQYPNPNLPEECECE